MLTDKQAKEERRRYRRMTEEAHASDVYRNLRLLVWMNDQWHPTGAWLFARAERRNQVQGRELAGQMAGGGGTVTGVV